MKNALFLILILLASGSSLNAQDRVSCPVFSIAGPSGVVAPGAIANYTVVINSDNLAVGMKFTWTTSSGSIVAGQGTKSIEVIQPNECITVTVEVEGLPQNCASTFSEMTCGDPPDKAILLDEISGKLGAKQISAIESAINKYRETSAQIFVVITGTERNRIRTQKIKIATLKKLFRADPSRVTFVVSDLPLDRVDIWAVPVGADPPDMSNYK